MWRVMSDHEEHLRTALAARYAIERELGRGGMATVYLAEDLKHHRPHLAPRPEIGVSGTTNPGTKGPIETLAGVHTATPQVTRHIGQKP
jgi:serine/threonine protein kinase